MIVEGIGVVDGGIVGQLTGVDVNMGVVDGGGSMVDVGRGIVDVGFIVDVKSARQHHGDRIVRAAEYEPRYCR